MTTTMLKRSVTPLPMPLRSAKRSSLFRLYLIRGLLAVVWAAAFAKTHDHLGVLAITLLVIYPLIDAASSLIDYRTQPRHAERRITAFNAALSALAAMALGVAGSFGAAAALAVFGAWAVIAGAAQLVLGLRRRGPDLGRQWPMLIAGGLSFLVGIFYGIQAAGAKPSLEVLSTYATGGGVFFIIQAGLLAWRTRQRRQAAN
jgi:uncharacterized membrane protein HdeD (DUF308 family)